MALARLTVKVGKRGKAAPHAAYIAREGKYKKSENVEKLQATGFGNMPKWAEDKPQFFWKMADEHERKNGTAYREHIISLPRELTGDEQLEFVMDWIHRELGERHPYQFAIHNPRALDGGEQPHVHLMFSERSNDGIERGADTYFKRYNSKNPERGGAKKSNTGLAPKQRKFELKAQRQRLEDCYNRHLERAGLDVRVNMKSLAERGIKRPPVNISMTEIKLGSGRVDAYKTSLVARGELAKLRQQAKTGYANCVDEIRQIRAEREERQRQIELKLAQERQRAQERLQAQQERQRAQERLQAQQERQRAQERLQAQQERQRAQERLQRVTGRTAFELLGIRINAKYWDAGRFRQENFAIGSSGLQTLIEHQDSYRTQLTMADNSHLESSQTAQNVMKFILTSDSLTNHSVAVDYGYLPIRDFVKKYHIEHDFDDLLQFDKEPTPEAEPRPQTLEQKNSNSGFDLDM